MLQLQYIQSHWSTVPEQMCMLLASTPTEEKADEVQKPDVHASS